MIEITYYDKNRNWKVEKIMEEDFEKFKKDLNIEIIIAKYIREA